jgi:hypothetical protein
MAIRTVVSLAGLAALLAAVQVVAGAQREVDAATLKRLATLPQSERLTLDAFPAGPNRLEPIRFSRVSIYAKGAHVYAETANGRIDLPRSDRIYLRGYSDDGSTRVALALNPDASFAHGSGSGPEGTFRLHATIGARTTTLAAQILKPPAGASIDIGLDDDQEVALTDDLAAIGAKLANSPAMPTTSSHALRFAIVAIDTDTLFMSRLFANNTTDATNWIAGMFNTMNLMYERDLLVQLQIGDTTLRTNPLADPYTTLTTSASSADLDLFSGYWKTNEGSVPRTFAALLSGVIDSTAFSCGFRGRAWINQYCQKGTTQNTDVVGSYSVDNVCSSISIDPDGSFNALLLGHELGHNFGAYHTHCTNASSGVPTASNFIDQCASGESVLYNNQVFACYSGATSCPAAGAGTIMSYCNMNASGCVAGTQNLLQFNTVQASKLGEYVSAAPNGCLNTTDDIFFGPFE